MPDDLFADLLPPAPGQHYRAARALAKRMPLLADGQLRLAVSREVCGQIREMLRDQARLAAVSTNAGARR